MKKLPFDENEIERYSKTDWVDILVLIAASLFITWVLIQFIITPDRLIAWFA
jgi:hypothetical protein